MKKVTVTLLLLCVGFMLSNTSNAQCKFKSIKKYTKYAISEDCNVTVDIATKPRVLFKKFSTGAVASFVKSGNDYYLYFYQVRSYSGKYEIQKENSFVAIFDNGESLTLYPCGTFSGKRPGISLVDYGIGCFYSISKSQLQQVADNTVEVVQIHITSENDVANTQIDEDGSRFFEYTINSENNTEHVTKAASCILTK